MWLLLLAVFAIGLLVRVFLLPIERGEDFVVWNMASTATLRGVNIYAHHPHYPAGPYAYFPLFIYLELPFQWLAQHFAISFTILGKIPVLFGDVLCTYVVAAELDDKGQRPVVVAAGAALFFLNPLVLDNGALYGRFDSLGCAVLMLAIRWIRKHGAASRGGAVLYALAVAVKTFPVFAIFGLIRTPGPQRRRVVIALAVVLGSLSLPYLGSLPAYVRDVVLYNAGKNPQGLSWQAVFPGWLGFQSARWISYALLAVFVGVALWLAGRVADFGTYVLLTLLVFLLCSKVVLPQYLTWPMPLLILATFPRRDRHGWDAAIVLAVFTLIGIQTNPYYHPFGENPPAAIYLLAGTMAAYVVLTMTRTGTATRSAPGPASFVPALTRGGPEPYVARRKPLGSTRRR